MIVFETESDISEFLISGADLKKASALYGSLCFCYPAGYFDITSGCIKGVKLSNTEWRVDINIEAEKSGHTFTKMLSETFKYN